MAEKRQGESDNKNIALTMTVMVITALILGLVSVWLNIERVDKAYEFRRMERELNEKKALATKLEVERDNLLSPLRLRKLAKEYGYGPASQGQIRKPRKGASKNSPE
ncbi:hypothetical protein [Maridesulfovibrio bastinii]|uniref:hypothetical protein n=1 Tax=Maridesulfovibrio bastinii TaxID=47157 RepID=UPI000404DFC8|nr:hypothetical protein [Maridesulfovibrio bastinii]